MGFAGDGGGASCVMRRWAWQRFLDASRAGRSEVEIAREENFFVERVVKIPRRAERMMPNCIGPELPTGKNALKPGILRRSARLAQGLLKGVSSDRRPSRRRPAKLSLHPIDTYPSASVHKDRREARHGEY
ncbi:MAG: hypothetical protein KDA61_06205 [Planctomycetales bacterium]|nr:hypothetical protein [Planctomycetales bacterium]